MTESESEDETEMPDDISPEWINAARNAGLTGTDDQVAETLFYAICGVVASPKWLATQPVEHDDFASVPLPSDPAALRDAAKTGREYANLVDPTVDVSGVTTGKLRKSIQGVGTPDKPTSDPVALTHGRFSQIGGRFENDTLFWNDTEGWRNLTEETINFELGGFRPITKHLSYFVDQELNSDDRMRVANMARRIVAMQELGPEADAHFDAAAQAPLETT